MKCGMRPECQREAVAFGLCSTHYSRWRKWGDPFYTTPVGWQRKPQRLCGMQPECQHTDIKGYGLCQAHYTRWKKWGDPYWGGEIAVFGSDDIGYIGMHLRLRDVRGSASNYACATETCDRQAQEWSYNHNDPNEKITLYHGFPVAFSVDLSFYEPLCKNCHRSLDRPRTLKCHMPDCQRTNIQGHGLCATHYMRWRKYGDPFWGGTRGGRSRAF